MAPPGFATDLRQTVLQAAERLRTMSEEDAARRPEPAKWSPKEIIGHLIDSASNNHQRFVRARFRADLRFEGYDQDMWVDAQDYRSAPWPGIVDLWAAFNLHLAHVMETTSPELLRVPRRDHNLDRIAWETVPADEPVTLEYFMRDYVAHLKHHLRQIDPRLATDPARQRR
jgi:hypothetical protein